MSDPSRCRRLRLRPMLLIGVVAVIGLTGVAITPQLLSTAGGSSERASSGSAGLDAAAANSDEPTAPDAGTGSDQSDDASSAQPTDEASASGDVESSGSGLPADENPAATQPADESIRAGADSTTPTPSPPTAPDDTPAAGAGSTPSALDPPISTGPGPAGPTGPGGVGPTRPGSWSTPPGAAGPSRPPGSPTPGINPNAPIGPSTPALTPPGGSGEPPGGGPPSTSPVPPSAPRPTVPRPTPITVAIPLDCSVTVVSRPGTQPDTTIASITASDIDLTSVWVRVYWGSQTTASWGVVLNGVMEMLLTGPASSTPAVRIYSSDTEHPTTLGCEL